MTNTNKFYEVHNGIDASIKKVGDDDFEELDKVLRKLTAKTVLKKIIPEIKKNIKTIENETVVSNYKRMLEMYKIRLNEINK